MMNIYKVRSRTLLTGALGLYPRRSARILQFLSKNNPSQLCVKGASE